MFNEYLIKIKIQCLLYYVIKFNYNILINYMLDPVQFINCYC